MCRQRALRHIDKIVARSSARIGVICAAKGHCDILGLPQEQVPKNRSDMCRQRALRPSRKNIFRVILIGVICAAKGHCDTCKDCPVIPPRIGVICAAKGHCDVSPYVGA